MNIVDLCLQGHYKTNLPLQHISVDNTGEIILNSPCVDSTLSFAISSNTDGESELDIFSDNLLIDSAKIYRQPLNMSIGLPRKSIIRFDFKVSEDDDVSLHNLIIDEASEIYHSSLNTHSVENNLPIQTKENAFVFVVDQNFLGFLQLFLLTLQTHNTLKDTSLIGLIPTGDVIAKQFLIDNNISIIEYNKTSNLQTAKQIVYMDIAKLCTSNYLCLIDLDMMILGDIEKPFDILRSLTSNTMLLCHEQGMPENMKFGDAFNNQCVIYPMNEDYTYIDQFVEPIKIAPVINNGLSYASRKVFLQFSNFLRTYSSYFRKWIACNEKQCGWSEQGVFNIASCNNQIAFLNPSYNVQANTQQEYITKEQEKYKYKNEPIQILHLNGSNRSKYHEYLSYGIKKYKWNIFDNITYEQMEKIFPEYFDSEVSYDCLEEIKNKNVLCYTNKLDFLCKTKDDKNMHVITQNHMIDAIYSCLGKQSWVVIDILSYINSEDLSKYDILVINEAATPYQLRAIADLIKTKNIEIPIYCKIHHSTRINKILPYLQDSNIQIHHSITNIDRMYEYYFVKVQACA